MSIVGFGGCDGLGGKSMRGFGADPTQDLLPVMQTEFQTYKADANHKAMMYAGIAAVLALAIDHFILDKK